MLQKKEKIKRCHKRVRAKVSGTVKVPRLCVSRSTKHIYAQLIDDQKGKTILSVSDLEVSKSDFKKFKIQKEEIAQEKTEEKKVIRKGKVAVAYEVGRVVAGKALESKIKKVVFDRGGHKYHGRVKAVAEGARDAGLEF